jgi:hypothetical protein
MASFDDIPKPEWAPEVVSRPRHLNLGSTAPITLAVPSRTKFFIFCGVK